MKFLIILFAFIICSFLAETEIKYVEDCVQCQQIDGRVCRSAFKDEAYCCDKNESSKNCGRGIGAVCTEDYDPKLSQDSQYLLCPNPPSCPDTILVPVGKNTNPSVNYPLTQYCKTEVKIEGTYANAIDVLSFKLFDSEVSVFLRNSKSNKYERISALESTRYYLAAYESLVFISTYVGTHHFTPNDPGYMVTLTAVKDPLQEVKESS